MKHITDKRTVNLGLAIVMAFLVITAAPLAFGQECLSMMPGNIFDTSESCSSEPQYDRALGSHQMSWNGNDYLVVNIGNELMIWDISVPQAPLFVAESEFRVQNQGDSDYDLMAFSVCDDCRYGAAWYKMGTVLFDLGDGAQPEFRSDTLTLGANYTFGGFTFTLQDQQYLISASGVPGSCDGTATLFQFNGDDPEDDLVNVGCIHADTRPILPSGGYEIDGHLYIGDSSTRVFLFSTEPSDSGLDLTYLGQPMFAFMARDYGLAIDRGMQIAVEANSSGGHIWDISNPGDPQLMSSFDGNFSRATVAYPRLFVSLGGVPNTEQTYDISRLGFPVLLDQQFWDEDQSWNHPEHACSPTQAANFSHDASTLYLMRYSRIELVDSSTCATPEFGAFYLVPAAAKVAGSADSFFLTDLAINNSDSITVTYRVLWLPRGEDNAEPVRSQELALAPGSNVMHADVLGTLLGLDDGAIGAIAIVADSPNLLLASRTFNSTGTGTFGQGIPGYASGDLIPVNTLRRILFFVENDDFRTNLGMVNGTGDAIRINWERFSSTGISLEEGFVDLPAWGNTQINQLFAADAPIVGGYVDVWTTTPGGAFAAYGSMLDNITSDPTTILPQ